MCVCVCVCITLQNHICGTLTSHLKKYPRKTNKTSCWALENKLM